MRYVQLKSTPKRRHDGSSKNGVDDTIDKSMIIYLITNLTNNKKYVGQTSETLSRRWTKHQYNARIGSQQAICRAIRKYGIEAFKIEVISECDSKDFCVPVR